MVKQRLSVAIDQADKGPAPQIYMPFRYAIVGRTKAIGIAATVSMSAQIRDDPS